jgi:photosystem II stability/assembly factor-like uncharacterized protein
MPISTGFWNPEHGIIGGFVEHGTDGKRALVAVTGDGGKSWRVTYRGTKLTLVDSVAVVPGGSAWATARGCVSSSFNSLPPCRGVLVASEDWGTTWHRRHARTWATEIDFVDAQRGWATRSLGPEGYDGLMATTDGGRRWRLFKNPCAYPIGWPLTSARVSPTTGWVLCNDETKQETVMFTKDGGRHWKAPHPPQGGMGKALEFVPKGAGWLVEGQYNGDPPRRTRDGGRRWHVTRYRNDWCRRLYDVSFTNEVNGHGLLARLCNGRPPMWADLVETHDGGKTWRFVTTWHFRDF